MESKTTKAPLIIGDASVIRPVAPQDALILQGPIDSSLIKNFIVRIQEEGFPFCRAAAQEKGHFFVHYLLFVFIYLCDYIFTTCLSYAFLRPFSSSIFT